MQRKKKRKLLEIKKFAEELNLQTRTSKFGISIISDSNIKFFDIDYVLLYEKEIINYIKKETCLTDFQTKLI